MNDQRKTVAAIITEYRRNSHADVIVGRLLEGYEYYGERRTPQVRVVSLFTDQVPANDMSRTLAAAHAVRVCADVREALTLGGTHLAVDGVVLIGEHGDYPENDKGQKLYPRWELFRQIVDVFGPADAPCRFFCDKHLSVAWDKAKWMVVARELGFRCWRDRRCRCPGASAAGDRSRHAVGPGCRHLLRPKAYGFHAGGAAGMVERRRRANRTGCRGVHRGARVWEWTDATLGRQACWASAERSPERALGRRANRA